MKRIKKFFAIAIALCLILGSCIVVYAADPYLDHGSRTGKINVQNYSNKYNDIWVSVINNGISAWNNSKANVSISVSAKSINTINAAEYNDTWYGLAEQLDDKNTGYTIKFTIKLNSRTISKDATNFANFAKSTVTHEFGHIFWLCDNPSTKEKSIMKHDRDRDTMTVPQAFDIKNVNAKY